MQRYEFELKGATSLLMHSDDVEMADALVEWQKDPANRGVSKPGDDRTPPWTWQTYQYYSDDGERVVMPSLNVSACLRKAATQIRMKGQKTFKEASQNGMMIEQENLQFLCKGKELLTGALPGRNTTFQEQADAVRDLGFRLFVKRVRVGQSKHIRVRPRFDNWAVRGSLMVLVPEITKEVLEQMFHLAGRVGLGDWRPGGPTPGQHGMFEASVFSA